MRGAALGFLAVLAMATPASAANWWYVGKTAAGFLYLDSDLVLRDHDKYVVLFGKTVPPKPANDGTAAANFQAFVGCVEGLDVHYYRRRWVDASGRELRQDVFERFTPDEAALAKSFACTDPMSWSGRGFELVRDPTADAARRQ